MPVYVDLGQPVSREEPFVRRKAAAFTGWHKPDVVTRDHNHAPYSVTKSILATLIGVLLKSGRQSSLDASVADIVAARTKLEADKLEKARRVRIMDVMSMASGLMPV